METVFAILVAFGIIFGGPWLLIWLLTFSPKAEKENREYAARQAEAQALQEQYAQEEAALTDADREFRDRSQIYYWQQQQYEKDANVAELREQVAHYTELYGAAGDLRKELNEARKDAINWSQVLANMKKDYRSNYPAQYETFFAEN